MRSNSLSLTKPTSIIADSLTGSGIKAPEVPWLAIKEWIPDDVPNLDWFNRPRDPDASSPDRFDQSPVLQASEVPLGDGYTLVLENS